MIKELYQQTVREVSLNVSAGRVESLRKKNVTKSGCRVYDNGYIGVAGCLGQPTADTWAAAERALAYLPLYRELQSEHIDTSELTPEQAARRIMERSQRT